MTISLDSNPDTIWSSFTSKHRKNIRRAYKNNLRVESGQFELLNTFYDLLCRSWRGLGTPIYRKKFFERILDAFGQDVLIHVAFKDDTPVATALTGHFRGTVEGMWAGSPIEYRNVQSNYVLYWEMIKTACEMGSEHFHLGRSSTGSGSESFKKKWSADTRQLYWQYYLPEGGPMPELNVDNPRYKNAIRLWQMMPVWMTRLVGPTIARSIP